MILDKIGFLGFRFHKRKNVDRHAAEEQRNSEHHKRKGQNGLFLLLWGSLITSQENSLIVFSQFLKNLGNLQILGLEFKSQIMWEKVCGCLSYGAL